MIYAQECNLLNLYMAYKWQCVCFCMVDFFFMYIDELIQLAQDWTGARVLYISD